MFIFLTYSQDLVEDTVDTEVDLAADMEGMVDMEGMEVGDGKMFNLLCTIIQPKNYIYFLIWKMKCLNKMINS